MSKRISIFKLSIIINFNNDLKIENEFTNLLLSSLIPLIAQNIYILIFLNNKVTLRINITFVLPIIILLFIIPII